MKRFFQITLGIIVLPLGIMAALGLALLASLKTFCIEFGFLSHEVFCNIFNLGENEVESLD